MTKRNSPAPEGGIRSGRAVWPPLLAALVAAAPLACLAPMAAAQTQSQSQSQSQPESAWRGLTVPRYPNATEQRVKTDDDEYKTYLHSPDNVRAIFDFYRGYLEKQGFRVTKSEDKKHGFKANMARGQGGPNDTVELDVKRKDGRYKVEIEFDE